MQPLIGEVEVHEPRTSDFECLNLLGRHGLQNLHQINRQVARLTSSLLGHHQSNVGRPVTMFSVSWPLQVNLRRGDNDSELA